MPTESSAQPVAQPSPARAAEPGLRPAIVQTSFWQQPMVQNLLPFATSLSVHLVILLIGILAFATTQAIQNSVLREQLIIPEAQIIENAPVGGVPNPGLGGDPNLVAAQENDPRIATSDGWNQRPSGSLTSTLMGGSSPDAADSVIGLGTRAGLAGTAGQGVGGAGGEGGGPMAPFGVPGGGVGLGPRSPFMGISGNARRVIYIVDASGSMLDVIPRVQTELRNAVGVLSASQAFNVVVFSDADVNALNPDSLIMATPDNKRKALEMASRLYAAGSTDPLPAIKLAFEQKPELIYVLTDGFDAIYSFEGVIGEFRKLNRDKKVKVNTILIRGSGNAELERVVRVIASENGGVCKIIDRRDL